MNAISSDTLVLALLGVITIVILSAVLLVAMIAVRDRSASKYDAQGHRAVLSEMRESYDRQLAQLNMQLTATEQRWRDVNHLLISSQRVQESAPQADSVEYTSFLRALGLSQEDCRADPRLVVLLTPFGANEVGTYKVISGVCARAGFVCVRGDEEFTSGDILSHIIKLIVRARIVVANISSRNANVFYELGIAHALDKQTILISRTLEEMPFDVKTKRIVLFRSHSELEKQFTRTLLQSLAQAPSES